MRAVDQPEGKSAPHSKAVSAIFIRENGRSAESSCKTVQARRRQPYSLTAPYLCMERASGLSPDRYQGILTWQIHITATTRRPVS